MVTHNQDLTFDAALAGGPVGGQHVDGEPVVPGKRRGLGVQRDRNPGRHVPLDHRLGAVIDDRARHPAEVGEPTTVAVPERGQIHARGEAGERITRVRQRHVEGVDRSDPDVGQQVALITPVDLGLGAGDDLEPAVQTPQRALIGLGELGGDPWPGLGQEHLHPLVGAGEPVTCDQTLMDHRPLQRDIGAQPRLDHRNERGDHLGLRAHPQWRRRRDRGSVLG